MKLRTLFLLPSLLLASALFSQDLPSVNVKDLDGNTVDIRNAGDSGKLTVISFWATWCAPCIKELEAINDHYAEWQTKYNMQLVAVMIHSGGVTWNQSSNRVNSGDKSGPVLRVPIPNAINTHAAAICPKIL